MVYLIKLLYFLRTANGRFHWSHSEIKRYQDNHVPSARAFLDEIPLSNTGKLRSVWSDISNA